MDRTDFLAPLGFQRLRLLDCLGGNSPSAPGYFSPDANCDVFAAFSTYITDLSSRWGSESDPLTITLLAAGRLLTGEIAAAKVIIDSLPARAFKSDHGAGYCVTAAVNSLNAALPLPADLKDTTRWLAGSPEQERLRSWFSEQKSKLRWSQAEGVYDLIGS
jgi:hypothetical protein